MKITSIRLLQLQGEMPFDGEFWEERLVRPLDLYPQHRDDPPTYLQKLANGRYRMESAFVQIETDEGVYGIGGPVAHEQAYVIARQLAPMLVGHDPLAIELIWDRIYRAQVHGRKGAAMMALSAVDCALWDLKGKWLGQPVYRLLGGPTRERIPAYASALGYAVEPERAAERAKELVRQGWKATKWFFRHGPGSGREGIEKNVALVQALREAIGPNVDLVLDAWMSWDLPYAVQMGRRIADYTPRWLEEPVLPDKIEVYAQIRRALQPLGIPISGGEHEYTRWGLKLYMDAGAVDVLQPDIYWCGGISETLKIGALASTYDLPVVPHGHSVPATCHVIASQPPNLFPLLEYLVKWNTVHQWFLKTPVHPVGGDVAVATLDRPGMGMELDEEKIEDQRELSFRA
ncbi:MAG: mandelate racemase/muconate lactonizing protein [Chloroflexi bacterium]|nr:mandelate racemase/muconate lactonizing protein [Chloroflexota bacterium]